MCAMAQNTNQRIMKAPNFLELRKSEIRCEHYAELVPPKSPPTTAAPTSIAPARGEDQRSKNNVPAEKNGRPPIASLIPYRPANQYRTLRQKCRAGRQIRPFSWGRPTR